MRAAHDKPLSHAGLCDSVQRGASKRAKGLEPSTFSLEGCKHIAQGTETTGPCEGASATPSSRPSSRDANQPADAELQRLIDAWPTLPHAVRAGIMAMVKATETQG